ncbi:hypothetical protein ACDX78_01675 [Virgibacillus oceani]
MIESYYLQLFFIGNFVVATFLYVYLYKNRKLIGFQLGMNIALILGGIIAIASGVLLMAQFPFHYTEVTITTTLIGIIAGSVFGAMFDYQTFLTGFTNGLMMGIMSPMIGAVIDNNFTFIFFMEFTLVMVVILVIISMRGS